MLLSFQRKSGHLVKHEDQKRSKIFTQEIIERFDVKVPFVKSTEFNERISILLDEDIGIKKMMKSHRRKMHVLLLLNKERRTRNKNEKHYMYLLQSLIARFRDIVTDPMAMYDIASQPHWYGIIPSRNLPFEMKERYDLWRDIKLYNLLTYKRSFFRYLNPDPVTNELIDFKTSNGFTIKKYSSRKRHCIEFSTLVCYLSGVSVIRHLLINPGDLDNIKRRPFDNEAHNDTYLLASMLNEEATFRYSDQYVSDVDVNLYFALYWIKKNIDKCGNDGIGEMVLNLSRLYRDNLTRRQITCECSKCSNNSKSNPLAHMCFPFWTDDYPFTGWANVKNLVKCHDCGTVYCKKCGSYDVDHNIHVKCYQPPQISNTGFDGQQCPNCEEAVYKEIVAGGTNCNHMTCRCGQHFCYVCGEALHPTRHFEHFTHSDNPHSEGKCPLY